MSVEFDVVPAVAASWPVICSAAAAAAAALGYKTLRESAGATDNATGTAVEIDAGQVVAESMRVDATFTVAKDDVTTTFRRTADGRATVHVAGAGRSDAELEAIGRELVGRVTQQFAYNKVLTELKRQGFTVTGEEVSGDQTIHVRVSRYV
jgi:hypothetical protein